MKEKEKVEEEAKLVIKQKYNYLYEIINRNGSTIFLLLVFIYVAYKADVLLYYGIILAVYFIYLIGSIITRKINYHKTYFAFYEDKLVYYQAGFGKRKQEIDYTQIDTVIYQKLILQQMFKQGDLIIKLKSKNIFSNRIILYGIPDVEEECKKVKEIIDIQ